MVVFTRFEIGLDGKTDFITITEAKRKLYKMTSECRRLTERSELHCVLAARAGLRGVLNV